MPDSLNLTGQLVDIFQRKIYPASLRIENGYITEIEPITQAPDRYIMPGFVDAHVHIESSMLTPCQFARLAVVHGTVATVSDPHEIGNVLGLEGVRYMIENGKSVPFYFYFGAPSCVPATQFETAGAEITVAEVDELLQMPEIHYLAEMMNFPGVLNHDAEVMAKIAAAKKYQKPIDGHAPGLRGEQARQYIQAGMSTDHECFTKEEALDKLQAGMKILIREGSAAKNFDALIDLLHDFPNHIMFCSDDKHPDSLVISHIDDLIRRAVQKGHDLFDALQAACVNPVLHYGLDVGLLRIGDAADFVVAENLNPLVIQQTYIKGQLVAEKGQSLIPSMPSRLVNQFHTSVMKPEDFRLPAPSYPFPVIEAIDGQLITQKLFLPLTPTPDGLLESDLSQDVLKITVVNRYAQAKPAVALVKNFGLKQGAIASSVAHDSHNIIAVGTTDAAICQAVNVLMEAQGGLVVVSDTEEQVLPLPIAGLMTGEDGYAVAHSYEQLDLKAKQLGCTLQSPFMTLSFMALLVIPSLKLSDKGLFDGDTFQFIS